MGTFLPSHRFSCRVTIAEDCTVGSAFAENGLFLELRLSQAPYCAGIEPGTETLIEAARPRNPVSSSIRRVPPIMHWGIVRVTVETTWLVITLHRAINRKMLRASSNLPLHDYTLPPFPCASAYGERAGGEGRRPPNYTQAPPFAVN